MSGRNIDLVINAALRGGRTFDEVESSLANIDQALRDQARTAGQSQEALDEYRRTLDRLNRSNLELKDQRAAVTEYNRLTAAIARTEEANRKAKEAHQRKAQAIGDVSQASERDIRILQNLSDRVNSTTTRLDAQRSSYDRLGDALRQNGIDTNNLARERERLDRAMARGAEAANRAREESRRLGEQLDRTTRSTRRYGDENRTALSLLQRVRGEILSVAAGFIGLYAAIENAKTMLSEYNEKQGILIKLSTSFNDDMHRAGEEYDYVAGMAERLGLVMGPLAKQYTNFMTQITQSGGTIQEARYIFESFAELGTVQKLTKDQLDGVFTALNQIVGKGKFTAEEVQGQLAERLVAPMQMLANALKIPQSELRKMMQDGKLGAKELIHFAEQYRDMVKGQLPLAVKALSAEQGRLNTEMGNFRLLISESGLLDTFADSLRKIIQFLRSDSGKDLAKDIADGLKMGLKFGDMLLDNLDAVKTFMKGTFYTVLSGLLLLLGKFIVRGVTGLIKVVKILGKATTGTMSWTTAIKELGKELALMIPIVGMVGTAIASAFETNYLKSHWALMKGFVMEIFEGIRFAAIEGMLDIRKKFGEMQEMGAKVAKFFGRDDLAKDLADNAGIMLDGVNKRLKVLRDENKELLRLIRKRAIEESKLAGKGKGVIGVAGDDVVTEKPDKSNLGENDDGPSDEEIAKLKKEAKKRKATIEQIALELDNMQAALDKRQKDSYVTIIKGVGDAYGKLFAKIKDLGGEEAKGFADRLRNIIGKLQDFETGKFNDKLVTRYDGLLSKLDALDTKASTKKRESLDHQLNAIRASNSKIFKEIADYRILLETNVAEIQDRLQKDTTEKGRARYSKMLEGMQSKLVDLDKVETEAEGHVDTLSNIKKAKFLHEQYNKVLTKRNDIIAINNELARAGLISEKDAISTNNMVIADYKQKLEDVYREAIAFIDAMRRADPDNAEMYGDLIIQLDLLKASATEAKDSLISVNDVNSAFTNAGTKEMESMAKAMGQWVSGVKSGKEALKDMGRAHAQFAADILRDIAKIIIQELILRAIKSSGIGGVVSGAASVSANHTGGMVGQSGMKKMVSPAVFANAPKYHGGGFPGLRPNEVPTILERGEEVLTSNDPRHAKNGGKGQQVQQSTPQNIKIVNTIDSGEMVSEGLSTTQGERAILNVLRANRSTIKTMVS